MNATARIALRVLGALAKSAIASHLDAHAMRNAAANAMIVHAIAVRENAIARKSMSAKIRSASAAGASAAATAQWSATATALKRI